MTKLSTYLPLTVGTTAGTARNHAICSRAICIATVLGGGYPARKGWSPETEALAADIARACNCHDDLVEACKAAEEWLSGWASAEPYLTKIRAALAKATV